MNRPLSCEPWPVSNLTRLLSQFLEGIISLFVTRLFALHFLSLLPFAAGFFASAALLRGFAAAFAAGFAAALALALVLALVLAAGFLAGAFLAVFGASSSSSTGAATFSFFGRGP